MVYFYAFIYTFVCFEKRKKYRVNQYAYKSSIHKELVQEKKLNNSQVLEKYCPLEREKNMQIYAICIRFSAVKVN